MAQVGRGTSPREQEVHENDPRAARTHAQRRVHVTAHRPGTHVTHDEANSTATRRVRPFFWLLRDSPPEVKYAKW